jgi:ABC-2 type transport system permease protein
VLPSTVDETLAMGWYGPALPDALTSEMRDGGLVIQNFASDAELQAAVLAGDQPVGIALPENFFEALAAGQKPRMSIYYQSAMPDEYRQAYTLLMEELGYMLAGQSLNLEADEVLLGQDMAGRQIAPRQRMLPLLAVFILAIETMALSTLFTAEVETGTLRALLVTPLRLGGLFLSKGITAVTLVFSQVLLLLLVTGGLRREPLLLLVTMLLGSLLITGISFLISSVGRDMMSVMGWGMLALIVLAIPSFNILLPGLTTGWIKALPSYYLVDTVYRVINFEAGWSDVAGNLLALLLFSVAFIGLGIYAMSRRLR